MFANQTFAYMQEQRYNYFLLLKYILIVYIFNNFKYLKLTFTHPRTCCSIMMEFPCGGIRQTI